jgi:hypothetical protein
LWFLCSNIILFDSDSDSDSDSDDLSGPHVAVKDGKTDARHTGHFGL